MSLIHIGKANGKDVFVTPYSQKRFEQRNLSFREALQILEKRDVSYPADEDGRQKIRSKISGKDAFLVVMENQKQITIITGGEA